MEVAVVMKKFAMQVRNRIFLGGWAPLKRGTEKRNLVCGCNCMNGNDIINFVRGRRVDN
jgi:hypothetical protein